MEHAKIDWILGDLTEQSQGFVSFQEMELICAYSKSSRKLTTRGTKTKT